jgi:hypothetical protein
MGAKSPTLVVAADPRVSDPNNRRFEFVTISIPVINIPRHQISSKIHPV